MNTQTNHTRFLDLKIIIIYITSFFLLASMQILLFTIAPSIINDEILFIQATVLLNVVWYVVLTTGLLIVTRHYFKKDQWPKTKANKQTVIKLVLIGIGFMFLANLLSQGVFYLLDMDGTSENQAGLERMAEIGLLPSLGLLLFAGFLAPIAEEIVFRKGLYGLINKRFGNLAAILINAFLFALIHVVSEFFSNPLLILPYLLLGIVLSYAYYKSGKLLIVPIAMHMVMNLLSVAVIFFV